MEDDFKLGFLSWCLEPPISDKIWGWLSVGDRTYAFWGPRGGSKDLAIRFKQFNKWSRPEQNISDAKSDGRKKLAKGYQNIDVAMVNGIYPAAEGIYPGFSEHLKNQLMMARLCGKVMREE